MGHGGEEEEEWTATVRIWLEPLGRWQSYFPSPEFGRTIPGTGEPEEDLFPLGHAECQGSVDPPEVMFIRPWDQCVWSPGEMSGPEVQIGRA